MKRKNKYQRKLYFIFFTIFMIYVVSFILGKPERDKEKNYCCEEENIPEELILTRSSLLTIDMTEQHVSGISYKIEQPTEEEEIEPVSNKAHSKYSKQNNYVRYTRVFEDDNELYELPNTEVVEEEKEEYYQVWSVCNSTLDEELQKYLYTRLKEKNIEWLMPYLIGQAYQESRFNLYATATHGNGICDCGLFQFRNIYWNSVCEEYLGIKGLDIYSPYNQIDVIVERDYQWINKGYSIEQIISYHYTSEYHSGIDWNYFSLVIKWKDLAVQIL